MARRSRKARHRRRRYSRRRFDWRRFLRSASPGQFLLGVLAAVIGAIVLLPILTMVSFVILLLLGIVFIHVGGIEAVRASVRWRSPRRARVPLTYEAVAFGTRPNPGDPALACSPAYSSGVCRSLRGTATPLVSTIIYREDGLGSSHDIAY